MPCQKGLALALLFMACSRGSLEQSCVKIREVWHNQTHLHIMMCFYELFMANQGQDNKVKNAKEGEERDIHTHSGILASICFCLCKYNLHNEKSLHGAYLRFPIK